jgi:hypothetical protein
MVLSTACKYFLKKYSNCYSKAHIQDRIAAFKEKILRKTGIAKIRDRLAGVQPEQEGPAPEEVPQEQPQSDVETLKRKRGGRKQKQVQPVAEEAQE